MHPSARPSTRVRVFAMALAPLADALLLLPFLLTEQARTARPSQPVRITAIWLSVPASASPETPPPTATTVRTAPTVSSLTPTPPAIPTETPATPASPAAPIDWQGQAKEAAARQAAKTDEPPTFSPPPRAVRQPCKPRESSFEWNPEQPRAGLLPLPYVLIGKRCVVGLGFFSCTLGELPPPNSHLFDDMKEGKTQASSVPDPNICD